jgi:hypothetical protein
MEMPLTKAEMVSLMEGLTDEADIVTIDEQSGKLIPTKARLLGIRGQSGCAGRAAVMGRAWRRRVARNIVTKRRGERWN